MENYTDRTLLLVEDEAIIALYEAKMLEKYGFKTIIVDDGEEAVTIATTNPDVDLVLMDINLAGEMDGPQAAESILAQRELPVVFLSGHTEREVVEKTERITSYGYVLKSSPESVVVASVKMAFRLHEARRLEKEKEARLREQDTIYRGILRTTRDGFVMTNQRGDLLEVNEAYCAMSGYAREELLAMNINQMDLHGGNENVHDHIGKMMAIGHDRFETLHCRKDGSSYPVEVSIQYLPVNGDRVVGFIRDITARKQAEEKLRASQARYKHISSVTSDIAYSCRWTAGGQLVLDWVSGAVEKITGYSHDDLVALSSWGKLVVEEDYPLFERWVTHLSPGEVGECELRIRCKDGELRWLQSKAECAGDGEHLELRIFGGLVDITARKAAGAALADSLTKLERREKSLMVLNRIITLANSFHDMKHLLDAILVEALNLMDYDAGGIYLLDPDGQYARVVHSVNIPQEFLEIIQVVPTARQPYHQLFVKGEPLITEHYERVSAGHAAMTGFCSLIAVPLFRRDRVVGAINLGSKRRYSVTTEERETLLSISRELVNVFDRIASESESINSARNMETLFNSIDEMVFLLDMQGTILQINDAVKRKLHFEAEELVGQNVLMVHVPDRRDEALRIVMGMIAGELDACPVPVLTKEGIPVEVETKVTRGVWNNEEILIGVTRDVTERKRAEEALEQAYQEKRFLLQELQHRAKNSFAMINSIIGLMADAQTDEAAKKALAELYPRVRSMAELYDLLYTTDTITKVRLSDYFSRISASLIGMKDIALHEDYDEMTVRINLAAPFGLILTELLTNITKHAFQGRQKGNVWIRLESCNDRGKLVVRDDGVGLPANFRWALGESQGLPLVEILSSQLQGQFKMENAPQGGTIGVLDFPLLKNS